MTPSGALLLSGKSSGVCARSSPLAIQGYASARGNEISTLKKEFGILGESSAYGRETAKRYQAKRRDYWDFTARKIAAWTSRGGYYHGRLFKACRFLVSPGLRILEIRCSKGDLLADLDPSRGVVVDFSEEMLLRAQDRHPELSFIACDAHELDQDENFDVIILSDVVYDLWDGQVVLGKIMQFVNPETRVLINSFSRVWERPLKATQKLRLSTPLLPQNWLTADDTANMRSLTGHEVICYWLEVI